MNSMGNPPQSVPHPHPVNLMTHDLQSNSDSSSNEDYLTPEELITQMSSDELQELLGEIGFEASESMAQCIQDLVKQMGSLEAAINALSQDKPKQRAA
jgi:hypothetical protein